MKPNKNTKFLPLSEIGKYTDESKYICTAIVFSPDTENDHFIYCPPYIKIEETTFDGEELYFEVSEIIAYYAKIHAGFTMRGVDNYIKQGEDKLREQIKSLLNIE